MEFLVSIYGATVLQVLVIQVAGEHLGWVIWVVTIDQVLNQLEYFKYDGHHDVNLGFDDLAKQMVARSIARLDDLQHCE